MEYGFKIDFIDVEKFNNINNIKINKINDLYVDILNKI